MSDLEVFRHDIREWLENHAPKALMGYSSRDDLYWGGAIPSCRTRTPSVGVRCVQSVV